MLNEKSCLIPIEEQQYTINPTMNKISISKMSHRIRIIKNLMYLMSSLDFLLHCALMVEMDLFKQIYLTFLKTSDSYSIAVSVSKCHLLTLNVYRCIIYLFNL